MQYDFVLERLTDSRCGALRRLRVGESCFHVPNDVEPLWGDTLGPCENRVFYRGATSYRVRVAGFVHSDFVVDRACFL